MRKRIYYFCIALTIAGFIALWCDRVALSVCAFLIVSVITIYEYRCQRLRYERVLLGYKKLIESLSVPTARTEVSRALKTYIDHYNAYAAACGDEPAEKLRYCRVIKLLHFQFDRLVIGNAELLQRLRPPVRLQGRERGPRRRSD